MSGAPARAPIAAASTAILALPMRDLDLALPAGCVTQILSLEEWQGAPPIDLAPALGVRFDPDAAPARAVVVSTERGPVCLRVAGAIAVRPLSPEALLPLPAEFAFARAAEIFAGAVLADDARPLLLLSVAALARLAESPREGATR